MLPQNFEKIVNLSLSQIGIGPVHGNILCVSACICSTDALPLLIQLNQVLLIGRRYIILYYHTIGTFVDKSLLEHVLMETTH